MAPNRVDWAAQRKTEIVEAMRFFGILMDSPRLKCYIWLGEFMSRETESPIALRIRKMAAEHHVAYVRTSRDALAHHITRLAGDDVQLDEIEQLLVALQRSGHISRVEMVRLQAAYLHEATP